METKLSFMGCYSGSIRPFRIMNSRGLAITWDPRRSDWTETIVGAINTCLVIRHRRATQCSSGSPIRTCIHTGGKMPGRGADARSILPKREQRFWIATLVTVRWYRPLASSILQRPPPDWAGRASATQEIKRGISGLRRPERRVQRTPRGVAASAGAEHKGFG
jgi:hypothetical protein